MKQIIIPWHVWILTERWFLEQGKAEYGWVNDRMSAGLKIREYIIRPEKFKLDIDESYAQRFNK